MQMKTFSAPTMTEAMELVRFEMGADSIIVSTRDEPDGAVITAAIENTGPSGLKTSESLSPAKPPVYEREDMTETILQSLTFHGVPVPLSNRLTRIADKIVANSPTLVLAAAMDEEFSFDPISTLLSDTTRKKPAPIITLLGPPGVGKTITTAKLAALSAMGRGKPIVISTDTQRAGGIEQLMAFTRILDIDLKTTDTPEGLSQLLNEQINDVPVLIDTPGANPYDSSEMTHLEALAQAAGGEIFLVMTASGDAMETADIAGEFSSIGATRLFITRLDMARRLGSILAAADAGRLSFSDVSITPSVAEGINPINPVSLARIIMPYTDEDADGQTDESMRNQIMTEASI